MTGDSTLLTEFEEKAGPSITFGDSKGLTVGYGLITKENVIIDKVGDAIWKQNNINSSKFTVLNR